MHWNIIGSNLPYEILIEGEYFLKSKKSNSIGSEQTHEEDISRFDPLGLNEWFKKNC